jgi:hypothetical protein
VGSVGGGVGGLGGASGGAPNGTSGTSASSGASGQSNTGAGSSGGGGVTGNIPADYSTAGPADLPPRVPALADGRLKPGYGVGTVGWKTQVLTTVTGPTTLSGPVLADTAGTSSEAAAWADQALVGGYKIWMGNFVSERDARLFWKKQVRRYPALLKKLKPTLRRIHSGTSQVAGYRLLGGSLADRAAAEHVCGSILSRSPHNVCRVVLS